jgi:phytoene dehydrogenase-like protein
MAIASAARAAGAEIRTEASVARVLTQGGRASGVVLESGEEIRARTVVSTLDARRTFLGLVEPGTLDGAFEAEVRRIRFRGSSGKVNLALDALPSFTALPGVGEHLRGAISISPSTEHMERAYDDAVAGRFSRRPYVDIVIPTLVDPSMAPAGKHTMSCFVQYAPYDLGPDLGGPGGWDQQREAFGEAVIDTIAEFAPNIRDVIVGRQVLTPLDIERDLGLSEGNIFQAELSLEQLFVNRPAPEWARFRTPIEGLWMGGSAAHPGGGIMGAPGRLAALEILRNRRWRPRGGRGRAA